MTAVKDRYPMSVVSALLNYLLSSKTIQNHLNRILKFLSRSYLRLRWRKWGVRMLRRLKRLQPWESPGETPSSRIFLVNTCTSAEQSSICDMKLLSVHSNIAHIQTENMVCIGKVWRKRVVLQHHHLTWICLQ